MPWDDRQADVVLAMNSKNPPRLGRLWRATYYSHGDADAVPFGVSPLGKRGGSADDFGADCGPRCLLFQAASRTASSVDRSRTLLSARQCASQKNPVVFGARMCSSATATLVYIQDKISGAQIWQREGTVLM